MSCVRTWIIIIALFGLIGVPAVADGAASSAESWRPGSREHRTVRERAPRPPAAMTRTDRLTALLRKTHRGHAALRRLHRDHITQAERLLSPWLIRPIDGDTFAYGHERIRVQGINAPELADPGGFEASQRLAMLLKDGDVTIVPKATDRYGRTVAQVLVDGQDVAAILKREGYGPR